jgi:hypothetical protein
VVVVFIPFLVATPPSQQGRAALLLLGNNFSNGISSQPAADERRSRRFSVVNSDLVEIKNKKS